MTKKKKTMKRVTAKSKKSKKSKKIVKARKAVKKARKTGKAKATRKATSTKSGGSAARRTMAAAATAGTANVTMTIDFGSVNPSDVQSVRRIDGITLPTGRTSLSRGLHTAGWDIVSPTVRPIGFAVSITEDASGNTLLDRPNERTDLDGKGAGVETFTV